jgi:hypothetical protein
MRGRHDTKHGPNQAKVGLTGSTSLADQPKFGVFSKIVSYMCQGRLVIP